jgi:hypothetical protein
MGPFSKSTSSQDAFAQEVLDVVVAAPRVESARYDAEEFAIVYRSRGDEKDSGRIYLHNSFRETSGLSRRDRATQIHRLVGIVLDPARDETWEQTRPKLRSVVRGVSFGLGMPGAATVDNPVRMLSRPFQPFLVELVVVDEPTSMAYVTTGRLAEWGVSEDQVFAAARENLASLAAGIDRSHSEDSKPQLIRFVDSGDGYFTSMLLVEGFLAGLAARVGGRPVAFIPDKDSLLVASDGPGLGQLYQMMEEQFGEATRSVSPVAYTVDEVGRVVPYQAPAGSDLGLVAHRAEVILASSEYAGQKEALDAQHERDGVDIFVGSVLVAQRPDNSVFSVAVWSRDVDTLLPEADFLAFQAEGEPLTVPFEVAVREASLLPEPGYAPVRFRVAAWPGEPVMSRLRAEAVTL